MISLIIQTLAQGMIACDITDPTNTGTRDVSLRSLILQTLAQGVLACEIIDPTKTGTRDVSL